MDTLVLGLSLLLAGVFGTAGIAKLLDPSGSRRALEEFGAPARLAQVGGVGLPLIEIAIALSLVFPSSARWGAIAAVILLTVFVIAISNALLHGRSPDCHCFGQVHSEPAGWSTLGRNAVLGGLAVVVAISGAGPSLDGWIGDRSGGELALTAAALAAAVVLALALRAWSKPRQRRRAARRFLERLAARRRPAGKPVGSQAPFFALHDVRGEKQTLETLRARGRPIVLVFVSPGCAPCRELLTKLGDWQAALSGRITIAVLSQGAPEANRPLHEASGLVDFLLQEESEIYDAYEARATPSAVVVDPHGRIASDTGEGQPQIEELIRLALRRSHSWEQPSLVA